MICIDKKEKCCGCTACQSVCPKQCIQMVRDEQGFFYPSADENKCTNCGMCQKVCPISNKKLTADMNSSKKIESFVSFSKMEEERLQSSSGGLFSVFARNILKEQGVVFGACFDEDFHVVHEGITSISELKKLRGSKYVQSRMTGIFLEVKNALLQEKKVLFVGTSCQISGLKCYLQKDYENLLTIDVLCHGVPSELVWDRYLKECHEKYGKEIKNINFRDKESGWKLYSHTVIYQDGNKDSTVFRHNPFMGVFLSNTCLRPSCYECQFKGIERDSDITIGDAWWIEQHNPELDDDKGASVMLVRTEKGKKLLTACKEELICESVIVDQALPSWCDARVPVKKPSNYDAFWIKFYKGASVKKLFGYVRDSYFTRAKNKIKNMLK